MPSCSALLDPTETSVSSEAATPSSVAPPRSKTDEQPFRHSSWQHQRQKTIEALYRIGARRSRIEAFEQCGCNAWVFKKCNSDADYKVATDKCHDRWCVPCSNERSAKIAAKLKAKIQGRTHRFITLTIASNDAPLRQQLDRLTQSFRKLRASKIWKETQTGGAAFIEVTYNRARRQWHPHLHVITEGKYIAQYDLRHLWKTITGDSFIVDIRLIRNDDETCRYVAKYASKSITPSCIEDPDVFATAIEAIAGKRLILTFGDWKNVKLTDTANDDKWERINTYGWLYVQAANGSLESIRILYHIHFGPTLEEYYGERVRELLRGPPAIP